MRMRPCARQYAQIRLLCLALLITVACMILLPGCRSTTPPALDPPENLPIVEKKTGQYDTIEVGDGFLLLSNMWATTEKTTQEIRLYEDGSYSWGWQRGASGVNDPNYPEVIYGVKPWGQGLDGLALPIQLKN